MITQCNNTGGSQFAAHMSAGTGGAAYATGNAFDGAAWATWAFVGLDTASTVISAVANLPCPATLKGFFVTSTTGTPAMSLRFKSVTSLQVTTIYANSVLKYRAI